MANVLFLLLPNQPADQSSDETRKPRETIKSGIHNAGAFVLLDGEWLCRPSLHVDGC